MSVSEEDNTIIITAAVLVIGDEILSGRTKDKNIGFIAEFLTEHGIDLTEVRIVQDNMKQIVDAVNTLRKTYDYVFTTGGIGPTHDDITADSIATAFQVGIDFDQRAIDILKPHYTDDQFNEARMRMTRIPFGAELIKNPISHAPGFQLENVFVMAGVPAIMQAMMVEIAPLLSKGNKMLSHTIDSQLPEGIVAKSIEEIQNKYDGVTIGSYPYFDGTHAVTNLVIRTRSQSQLNQVKNETEDAIKLLRENFTWKS